MDDYRNQVEPRGIWFPIKVFGIVFLIYAIPFTIIYGAYILLGGK